MYKLKQNRCNIDRCSFGWENGNEKTDFIIIFTYVIVD